jgi:hypothetical protein
MWLVDLGRVDNWSDDGGKPGNRPWTLKGSDIKAQGRASAPRETVVPLNQR